MKKTFGIRICILVVVFVAVFSVSAFAGTWVDGAPAPGERRFKHVASQWKSKVYVMNAGIDTFSLEMTWKNWFGIAIGANDTEYMIPANAPQNIRLLQGYNVSIPDENMEISAKDKRGVSIFVRMRNSDLYAVRGVVEYSDGNVAPFAVIWNKNATSSKFYFGNSFAEDEIIDGVTENLVVPSGAGAIRDSEESVRPDESFDRTTPERDGGR